MRKTSFTAVSFAILTFISCGPSKAEKGTQRLIDSIRVADSIKAAEQKAEEKGMRHYKMGELFMVGEATALAMRTNVKR